MLLSLLYLNHYHTVNAMLNYSDTFKYTYTHTYRHQTCDELTLFSLLLFCYKSTFLSLTVGAYVNFKDDILDIIVDSIIETVMIAME